MSWFDTTKGFVEIALHKAQKQIDKALDIQVEADQKEVDTKDIAALKKNLVEPTEHSTNWDSFTGSFFDNPNNETKTIDVPPKTYIESGNNTINIVPGNILVIPKKNLENNENDKLQCYNQHMDNSLDSSGETHTLTMSLDGNSTGEFHTVDSDSTQSFEEIHIQCSNIQNENRLHSIKLSSQNCSSHNSNDEMETTTSSDIEIISNPNGDSSSANSMMRMSPLKFKKVSHNLLQSQTLPNKLGHCREPSEISILSEDSQSELDKLFHRINELNEILESRELSLLESKQQNAALIERNNELQMTLDAIKKNCGNHEAGDDYTQRLSILEKRLQGSARERAQLLQQINELKNDLQNKIPKETLTKLETENNVTIEELRNEGEKLSKEILLQSNVIKKLRLKEKTNDLQLKKNKDQLLGMSEEIERLKKTLNAREEVERSQIETVHKISSEKRDLECENLKMRCKIEDMQSKLDSLQISFDAVKTELQCKQSNQTDFTHAEEFKTFKKETEKIKNENIEMKVQLSELRVKLRCTEEAMTKRERLLIDENRELLKRLEDAELRVETCNQEISLTTIPLVRQLESLQNTLTQRTNNWNRDEKALLEKLDAAETRLKTLDNIEFKLKETTIHLEARCKDLEEQLSNALMENEKIKLTARQTQSDHSIRERELNKKLSSLEELLNKYISRILELEDSNKMLLQRKHTESNFPLDNNVESYTIEESNFLNRAQSPSISYEKNSFEDIMPGNFEWQRDDIDCISNHGQSINCLNMNLGINTTTYEHLQSLLKQRDGEISQLHWQLSRLQQERNGLADEISTLTLELENIKEKLIAYDSLKNNYSELQHQYDALLEMYGEKVERTQELELDLVELKEAYKLQIDELLAHPSKPT